MIAAFAGATAVAPTVEIEMEAALSGPAQERPVQMKRFEQHIDNAHKTTPPMPLLPREPLHNRYRIVSLLAAGPYGAVYRAWDQSDAARGRGQGVSRHLG